jgi:hypothetical protein
MDAITVHRWILHYIIDPSILAPMAAYAWSRFRGGYQRPPWLRPFLRVQILDLIQGVIFIAIAMAHHNNQWFRHIVQPIIFTGLLGTLARTAEEGAPRTRLYLVCVGVGLAAAVTGIFVNGLLWRNSLFMTTQSLIYMGLGTYELRRLFNSEDDRSLPDRPEFWLAAALLVYGSSTLIFSATSNYLLRTLSAQMVRVPWIVNGIVIVCYELALAKVFLCRKSTSS